MGNSVNILLVDDEQIVLDSIRKHLRYESNYKLFDALSVAEALEVMDKNEINIVLTDLMMPDIDGLEYLKMLKEKNPNIIVIMITGYATINTALQAMQLGAFDYLAKPFTREELKKVVSRAAELINVSAGTEYEAAKDAIRDVEQEKMTTNIKGIGEHSWMMVDEDGSVLIGVERPFLYSMGRIQTMYLPEEGDEIRQGSVYFQLFSADLRSQSLLSPLSGVVLEVNQKVLDNPNAALQDPYGEGWLIKIIPSKFREEIKLMGL